MYRLAHWSAHGQCTAVDVAGSNDQTDVIESIPERDFKEEVMKEKFPQNFMWGGATAANQVEGA